MIKHQTIVTSTYDNQPSNSDIRSMAERHDKTIARFLEDNGLSQKEHIAKISTTPYPTVIFTTITWIEPEPIKESIPQRLLLDSAKALLILGLSKIQKLSWKYIIK